MKKQFAYELRRILLPLIIFTAAATVLFAVTALTSAPYYTLNYGIQYPRNTLYEIPLSVLGVLCFLVPALQFSYRMKKRSADLWYALPVRRSALLLQRLLSGLLLVFVPFTVSFAVGFGVIAMHENVFELQYYWAMFGALIPVGIALFGINAFLFTRANSIADGIVFELASIALLAMPFLFMNNVIPYSAPSALRSLVNGAHTLAPLFNTGSVFDQLIRSVSPGESTLYVLSFSCILGGIEGAAAYVGLFLTARAHRAENIEQPSASWFGYRSMIPVYVFFFAAVLAQDLTAEYLLGEALTFIGGLAAYIIFRRSFRLHLADWLWLCGSLVLGILLGVLGYKVLGPWFDTVWPIPSAFITG